MYSQKALERYESDLRVGSLPRDACDVGSSQVRSAQHGDVIRIQIRITEDGGVIEAARFKAFGCGWTIASASLAAEWLEGKTTGEALDIRAHQIATELELPEDKRQCATLATDAIRGAVEDYQAKRRLAPPIAPRTPDLAM